VPTDPRFWSQVLLQTLTLFALLVGWIGLLIPVFPGLVVMWLATLFYALVQNAAGRMTWMGWVLFAAITLLMLAGGIIDNIIIARQMRGRSIPWRSIVVAYVAGVVASLFLTPLAGLAASPLALFAMESVRLHDRRLGFKSARTYMVAWGWSFAAVFGTGFLILVLWLLWAFL
jgi:uncharacterized protein YqgC (DUF456 family)